jgi:hypothetical protein
MSDYIFILYSCKKNLEKTRKTYDKINDKIANTKVYIIYGEEALAEDHTIIDDKYIVLRVKDDYDHLADKTVALLKTLNHAFPTLKGVFKCDDDVNVNLNHINTFLDSIEIDYGGNNLIITNEYIEQNPVKYPVKYPCSYCGGPFYFLSKKALECFSLEEPKIIYYEDMLVGYHLNKFNIFPAEKYILYSDTIKASPRLSYHNRSHLDELYILIQGGLGNQLFQLACAIQMAEKYNKQLVLNEAALIPNPHQAHNKNITIQTLQQLFPTLPICNTKLHSEYFYIYKEEKNACFSYNPDKIDECFNTYTNVVLHGYFINYKYIPLHIFDKINVIPKDKKLLTFDFTNVYFIHIRLGDYLNHKMYQLNLKPYYNFCINRILSMNKDARFIICTNQYDALLQSYLKEFPAHIKYKIQKKENNDMDTLYIMSSCRGAICSNSTLSFMGSVLQKQKKSKEHVYMPYPFVNDFNIDIDMYPDWCSVYNTLNNTLM